MQPKNITQSTRGIQPKNVASGSQGRQPNNVGNGSQVKIIDVEVNILEVSEPTKANPQKHRGMVIPNRTGTPLDLYLPRGKYVPPPIFRKRVDLDLDTSHLPGININKVIPRFSRSRRKVTFISPSVKQQIAKSIVTTALKNLGKVVGSTLEQDKSFDHEEYIKQMGQTAKALNEACLKKHEKYKRQFYIGKTKN